MGDKTGLMKGLQPAKTFLGEKFTSATG